MQYGYFAGGKIVLPRATTRGPINLISLRLAVPKVLFFDRARLCVRAVLLFLPATRQLQLVASETKISDTLSWLLRCGQRRDYWLGDKRGRNGVVVGRRRRKKGETQNVARRAILRRGGAWSHARPTPAKLHRIRVKLAAGRQCRATPRVMRCVSLFTQFTRESDTGHVHTH